MAHDHSHGVVEDGNEKSLWWALGLTTTFMIVEVVAGVLSNSLALISDAAHMFTDTAALAIALAAIRIGKRAADKQRTFGYYRFEILAAAFNAILLFLVAMYILYEAWQRFQSPPEVQSTAMLIVAIVGLVVNVISMRLLMGRKDESLNVKGAYLEVWSDMLGSAGVIGGAIIIKFTGWAWVDTVVAVGIGFWVLPRTWTLLRESLNILLEGVPEGVEFERIEAALAKVDGVKSVHDLHVWAISIGKLSLTVHIVSAWPVERQNELLLAVRHLVEETFKIYHSTVQIEQTPCDQADGHHSFERNAHPPEHGEHDH
jgi:cobalt-zinc-cadmium efflux system protein